MITCRHALEKLNRSEVPLQAGVIAHAGVIALLCVNFSSLESFNSLSAQGSESSHRGAMTPILVPSSSVRLHAVACGLRIKIVPRSVILAVCNRGSPLFVAGAYHTYMKKLSLLLFFIRRPHQKEKKKKAPPALPRCGADLPSTAVPHATERRQPTTQLGFLCFGAVCALGAVRTNRRKAGTQAAVPVSLHPRGVFRVAHGRVRYRTGRTFKRCATSTAVGCVVSSVSHIHVGRTGVCVHITARQGV